MSTLPEPLGDIQSALRGERCSLHLVDAIGLGQGVQVKVGGRKVAPVIFPSPGETLADVLRLLAEVFEHEAASE